MKATQAAAINNIEFGLKATIEKVDALEREMRQAQSKILAVIGMTNFDEWDDLTAGVSYASDILSKSQRRLSALLDLTEKGA